MTMKRFYILFVLMLSVLAVAMPAHATDQISYTSQPDEIVIFLNNVAFARDTVSLPGGADVDIVLPAQIYQDTLVLRENGQRVSTYRINRNGGQILLQWQSASDSETLEVTLEYLLSGLSWNPKYDMWLGVIEDDDTTDNMEQVRFDFFAEVSNDALSLDDVATKLVAGYVDTSQQLSAVSTVTMNQMVAGYDRSGAGMAQSFTGQASIQHVYDVANITANPGDMVYVRLEEAELSARRLHFWNAQIDDQVSVIYKARNDSSLPFAEGIVRSYENGLFIGSDFVELTPIGGEGSITVGNLQDVRVFRTETYATLNVSSDWDTRHDVVLELTNFGSEALDIIVVDRYPGNSIDFNFSHEPQRQADNLFRWEITLAAGETLTISYQFKAYS
jgi:hypothetical protein